MLDGVEPPADAVTFVEWDHHLHPDSAATGTRLDADVPGVDQALDEDTPVNEDIDVESGLVLAAMLRDVLGPPEQTDADVERILDRAAAWEQSPVSRDRMLEINQLSLGYFCLLYTSDAADDLLC